MRNKILLVLISSILAIILLSGSFSGGLIVGRFLLPASTPPIITPLELPPTLIPGDTAVPETPIKTDGLFRPFWQTWDIVHDQFVDQPVDDAALMQGAIKGMLEALGDDHTSYMDPDQFRQANIPLEGEYEGIGAWVDPTEKYLTIISPMPDSPAEQAGLKPGDQIIAVDGDDVTGIDGNLVIRRVLGPAGTTVVLTIKREGLEEPFDVSIKRAHIIIPSIENRMLEGKVAYIHLMLFGDKTTEELRAALRELMAQEPIGLIFDLRNNGGGTLQSAIEVASEFIADGVIMYEEYGDGTRQTFTAIRGGLATEIPMVVLINEGTASASEIVAGAIQDHDRAKLIGVTSFGKGSVQNQIPLVDNSGAVRVTIARWLTPNDRSIHEVGLQPDIEVKITDEDIEANRDPQLDAALALLTEVGE